MLLSWKFDRKEKNFLFGFFLFGFLGGIAGICAFSGQLVLRTNFLDRDFWNSIKVLEINSVGLFLYSIRKRLGIAVCIMLVSAAGLTAAGTAIFALWCGVSLGTVLTVLSMRYGIKGLLLFGSSILPQQLLFIPAYLLLIDICLHRRERMRFIIPLAVVIIGCILESYVNPNVLKVVLKFF